MTRSKKSKMTDMEYAEYLVECEEAVYRFKIFVDFVLRACSKDFIVQELRYSLRTDALRKSSQKALKVIQSPAEVGDYHQPSLIKWRAQIRRLDIIAETYLRSLYKEKRNG